jgi:pimeloyl-ACP methyl ester carboxylesterase
MDALQYPDRWRGARAQLWKLWLQEAPASVAELVKEETRANAAEQWARAGREILAMYEREGDPLRASTTFDPPVPLLHVYAQPRTPEYLALQESFAQEHPWFRVRRLDGVSHFPSLEVPSEMAAVIREFTHDQR